ncbi:PREDICTED: trefoil factor 1 [Cercocebus atys]|uniref:Trefoil factor 1 n=1 Tax=Cercocebus atys TaxID=9531 RepID=A0A2K5NNV2_CERAT|nr:PREDICTED: trefoil factor 1 [Cercocebus atys]
MAPMQNKVICALVLVSMLALGTLAQSQTETCTVAPRERNNCGFDGITPSQCASRSCCFDDSVRGVPWCFHPNTIDIPPEGTTFLYHGF